MNESPKHAGRRRFLIAGATAATAVGTLAYSWKVSPAGRPSQRSDAPARSNERGGKTAPDFLLSTLDGGKVRLTDFRGKVVLLNFWATWCAPCSVEMPWLVEFDERYRTQDLQIIGVCVDDGDVRKIAEFVRQRNAKYPILLTDEAVSADYGGLRYLPQTFFIARDGAILKHVIGVRDKDDFEADVREALSISLRAV
jgi:peroxiredoxin